MKFKIYAWVNETANCYTTTWKENSNYMKLVQTNEIKCYCLCSVEHFIKFQEVISEKGCFVIDNEYFTAIL